MTEVVATETGKKLDARYTLLEKLGAGGQGEVWRAHDETRGEDIALKVLKSNGNPDEAWRALEHEYAIASRLNHPCILKVYAPERAGDAMVLPMELATGGDLRRLRGAGFLEIIPVLLELAQALEHAHERGVVHRDLKPGNVLFDSHGRARLADFGVAQTAQDAAEAEKAAGARGSNSGDPTAATRHTNRHGFSPFTASPAQLRGEPPTPADDIYGLGALAYELLSGYPPYYPRFDKRRAIEERVPTLVPTRQIPPLLGSLVMNMLAKDAKRRPRSMRDVIDELDAAINDTLTYDFENVSPATPTARLNQASGSAASSLSAASALSTPYPASTASAGFTASGRPSAGQSASASVPQGPAAASDDQSFVWTASSKDRRGSADRRGRRKEDLLPEAHRSYSDRRGAGRAATDTNAADTAADAIAASPAGTPSDSAPAAASLVATGAATVYAPSDNTDSASTSATATAQAKSPAVAQSGSSPRPRPAAPLAEQTLVLPVPDFSAFADRADEPYTARGSSEPRSVRWSANDAEEVPAPFASDRTPAVDSKSALARSSTQPQPRSPAQPRPAVHTHIQTETPRGSTFHAPDPVLGPGAAIPAPAILGPPIAAPPIPAPAAAGDTGRTLLPSASHAGKSRNVESAGYYANSIEHRPPRTGAEALARIDAAIERAAAETAAAESAADRKTANTATGTNDSLPAEPHTSKAPATPVQPPPRQVESTPTPQLTPAEAAAIVAAARAAASKPSYTTASATSTDNSTVSSRATSSAPAFASGQSKAPDAQFSSSPKWPKAGAAVPASTNASGAAGSPGSASPAPAPVSPAAAQSNVRGHVDGMAHSHADTIARSIDTALPRTQGHYADVLTTDAGAIRATWGNISVEGLPKVARLQPIRPRRWPWVLLGLAAGAAAAIFFWLPRFDTQTLPPDVAAVVAPIQAALAQATAAAQPSGPASATSGVGSANAPTAREAPAVAPPAGAQATGTSAGGAAPAANTTPHQSTSTPSEEQRLRTLRQTFDTRVAALEARGAGAWGGREFGLAKTRAAESVGAHDAGNPRLAQERLTAALKMLDTVDSKAPQALTQQVTAGEKALRAGQQEVAGQAFDLARRINPTDRRATDGQRRAQNLNAVLPLLADAQNAEVARDFARAAQDYSQALFLDPNNATAKAGQARSNAAFGDDNYAKAVGTGFAALGAGRLDEAHQAFVKARSLKPNGAEASEGLKRVSAALTARGFASMRQRALRLEAQERWEEAERAYEDVLAADASLAFAQEGKARTSSRAELSGRLQQLLDRPDRLSTPGVREDARSLLETAKAQIPQGPVIRSQIARLEILLPGFDKPVRLSLLSDNSTQIVIPSIGSFGAFSRRDIELRPGKYTVVGTRYGFRDVRREITVAPGQEVQTIKVTCSEPI